MKFKDKVFNLFNPSKYAKDSDSIIIACYFNPQRNPYRLKAFREFYNSVKHMDILITECVLEGTEPELVNEFPDIRINRVWTKNLLWHKEALLNNLIQQLPTKYKYVFWVDADVIFDNRNWLVEATEELRQGANLVQPFKYCVHMERDELKPSFDYENDSQFTATLKLRNPNMWHSFCYAHTIGLSNVHNYEIHGHVGFAWGARREILDEVPLYDKALVGGANHIIAHAATDYLVHPCIEKSFTENLDEIDEWSFRFYKAVQGKVKYATGTLFHIWHGDIKKRDYFNRVKEFTPMSKAITNKDKNGLYITDNNEDKYVKEYFDKRELKPSLNITKNSTYGAKGVEEIIKTNNKIEGRKQLRLLYPDKDDSFIESLLWGYMTDSALMGTSMGGNIVGATIGDILNTNNENLEMGGGSFGGGGAGGDWEENTTDIIDTNDTPSQTFS